MFKEILVARAALKKFIEMADATTNEVCGLGFGQWFTDVPENICSFEKLHIIENISTKEKSVDFLMNPIEAFTVLKNTRYMNKSAKEFYTGIIHSHPSGKPNPSSIDLRNANDDVVWIIYSPLYRKTKAWTYDKQNNEFYEIGIHYLEYKNV